MTRDEQTVAIFALRYAMGRRTYAFSVVSNHILDHAKELTDNMLRQIAEEVKEAVQWHDLSEWEKKEYYDFAEKCMALAEEVESGK